MDRPSNLLQDQTNDKYLGFFCNDDGKGVEIATGILDYFDKMNIDYSNLNVIGADSTSANTGYKVRFFS